MTSNYQIGKKKTWKIWKNIVNLASCPYADWGWLILNRILHSGEEIWILTSSGKSNVSLSNYTKNTSCFSESFQHFSRALNFQAFVLLSIDTSIHEKKKQKHKTNGLQLSKKETELILSLFVPLLSVSLDCTGRYRNTEKLLDHSGIL